MFLSSRHWPTRASTLLLLCAGLLISLCSPAFAQRGGGGLGKPPKPEDPGKGGPQDDRPTGTESGYIMKYEVPEEGEDEDVQAYVTLKPPLKGAKAIKVRILRETPPKIELGDKKEFEPEEIPEILTKGLFCRFSWKTDKAPANGKKKSKNLELTSVAFDNLEVSGKIDEITPDLLVIRCRPKNDRPWPDAKPDDKKPVRSGQTAPKPKPVAFKKLKLKMLDDVTQFRDADNQELDPSDFEANQTVDALVVYGKKGGIVLSLKSPTLRNEGEEESGDGRSDGFRNPPPR